MADSAEDTPAPESVRKKKTLSHTIWQIVKAIQPGDPVKNNTGMRSLFFGEATGLTAAVFLTIYLYSTWEPKTLPETFIAMLIFAHFVVWYGNAQSSGLVSATSRRNLGDDSIPVSSAILSMLPIVVCLVALALAGYAWAQHFWTANHPEPGVVGLSWPKIGIISVVFRLCWNDITLTAMMIARTARLNPETTMTMGPAKD
jgi:hypothetical protein